MKTSTSILLLAMCALTALSSCYTASFYPVPDYANVRLPHVETVAVRFAAPSAAGFALLGMLHVTEVPDARERSFQDFIKMQAARRGADTAWIMLHEADIRIVESYYLLFTPILPWAGLQRSDLRTIKVALYRRRQ